MPITSEHLEELKELLDRHDQDSDCQRTGECCATNLIEYLEDLLAE